ncbi:hypothetical protein D3248_08430 [Leucobacter zeae]|nr:hypothetical protein [Leucobacter zeae]
MSAIDALTAALGGILGTERADELLAQLDAFSNQPNAVKGAAKRAGDPEVESAALRVFVQADARTIAGALDSIAMWGLLTLAARADPAVLDGLPEHLAASPKAASIRRAATKHRKSASAGPRAGTGESAPGAATAAAADDEPALPTKISEVAKWIAAHPDVDPARFTAHPGQRAAARRVALRALGAIASPAALETLSGYASPAYSDAELAELHRAWGEFDRRDFAAAMFGPGSAGLRLGACSSIEGIGAVEGLTALDVILERHADLTPLAECVELRELRVHATIGSGLTSIEPIAGLPHLEHLELIGVTRDADLAVLRQTPIAQLYVHLDGADGSFLTEMPRLQGLRASFACELNPAFEEPDDAPDERPAHAGSAETVLALVRSGVTVVLFHHESWVPPFIAGLPGDVSAEQARGLVRLSRAA